MKMRPTTRRRLTAILTVAVIGIGSAAGFYEFRQHQFHARLLADRAAGLTAFDAGDYDTALKDLSRYNQYQQRDPQALFTFAKARSRIELPNEGHLVEAIAYYRRGLELDPKNAAAKHELLAIYINPYIAYNAEALKLCDELLSADSHDLVALRDKATALYRLHRLDEAMAAAEQLNKLAPLDMQGQQLSYELMYQLNRPADQILARAQKDFKAHPNDPRFEMLLGYAYMLTGQFDQSRTHLLAAAHARQTDPVVVQELCGMLDSLHLYDESNALLARSAEQNADPQMQQMLIRRLWQTGDFSQVAKRLANLSTKDGDSQLLGYQAMSLYQLNHADEAKTRIAALEKRMHDDVAMAWAKAISAQFAQPPLTASQRIAQFESALSRDPANAVIRDMLGDAYAELGETEPAMQQWNMAADAEPSWATPRTQIARLLAATGRNQMAIDEAQSAYDRAQNVGSAIALAVAWSGAAQRSDDPALASRVLTLSREIQTRIPGEPQTLPIYVSMLARTGQHQEAIAVIRNAITSQHVLDNATLIHLAAVSRSAKLGMEKQILTRAEQLHGLTPDLALAIATNNAAGDAKSAKQLLGKQVASAKSDIPQWRLAYAEFLESISDPAAAQTWIELGNANPDDLSIQGTIADLPENSSVWQNRAFIQTTIDRVHQITGDEGHRWQLARARWLLKSPDKDRDSAEAVVLLTELVRTSPNMLIPRMYLARALENLHEIPQAIDQLKSAAEIDPDSPDINMQLVQLMQNAGRFDDAAPYLIRLSQNKSLDSQQRLQLAVLLANSGQRQAAMNMLGEGGGLQRDTLRAALLRQTGSITAATQIYQQLITQTDTDSQTILEAAEFFAAHHDTANANRAIAALNHSKISPEQRDLLIAQYDEDTNQISQASQLLAKSASQYKDPTSWEVLAEFQMRQGDDSAAISSANHGSTQALADLKADITQLSHTTTQLTLTGLRDALSHHPSDLAGRDTLNILSQSTNLDQLAVALDANAEKYPRFMPAQKLAFEAALKQHHMDDAGAIANRCVATFPNDAEAAEMPVLIHAAAGQWSDMLSAAQVWRQRSAENPLNADLAIAEAQMQMGQADQAVRQLASYVATARKDPGAHENILTDYCRALVMAERQQDAANLLKPLLAQSNWRMLWLKLASEIQGADASAQWIAQVAPAIPQSNLSERESLAAAWYALGVRYGYANGFTQARQVITPVAAAPNAPASAQLLLAASAEKLTDRTTAVAAYRRALQLDPNLPVAENNLAYDLLLQNEHLDEARDLAQKAVAARSDDAAYRDTLGQILIHLGDRHGAIQAYQTLVQLQPNNVPAHITLAQTFLAEGDRTDATQVLSQIDALIQANPTGATAYQADVQSLHQSLTK